MRIESRHDSKHQFMKRSILSYWSFNTHIAYRLNIHAQKFRNSYNSTDKTSIYCEVCKTINFAIINLKIILFSVIHFWCNVFYILIIVIIIRLASFVYSKQFNNCTCNHVFKVRFERKTSFERKIRFSKTETNIKSRMKILQHTVKYRNSDWMYYHIVTYCST